MAAFKAPSTATFGGSDVSMGSFDGPQSPIKPHNGGASPRGVAVPVVVGLGSQGAGGVSGAIYDTLSISSFDINIRSIQQPCHAALGNIATDTSFTS